MAYFHETQTMIIPYNGITPKVPPSVFIAQGGVVIGDVEIGENASIWFNTVVRGDVNFIRIGFNTNIQDNSVLHVTRHTHPLRIGHSVTVGHRVILHGCTIGNLCLIGMGSVIMDGAVVEDGALIGAGSLVPEGSVIPSGMLAYGSPAKPKRPLNPEEKKFLSLSSQNYVEDAKTYMNAMMRRG